MLLSSLPAARVLPSGLNATELTELVVVTGRRGWRVARSHNRTLPSWLPAARVLPSGLNATELTEPVEVKTAMPGRAAAASMAWRAALEGFRRHAATLSSLDRSG